MGTMTGTQFKRCRQEIGMTQAQMGTRLGGYKARTVQSWERGERGIPAGVQELIETIADKQEALKALAELLLEVSPSADADELAAFEAGMQTVEKLAGMKFNDYLDTLD